LVNCSNITERNIENTSFNSRALTSVLKKYNKCIKPEAAIKNYNTKTKLKTNHIFYGSYALYTGDLKATSNSVGYFINIFNPKNNTNLSATTGINYLKIKSKNKDYLGNIYFNESNQIRIPLMVTNFFKKNNWGHPFIVAGAMLIYSFDKEIYEMGGRVEKTEDFGGAFTIGAGLVFKKHIYSAVMIEKNVFLPEKAKNITINLNLGFKL
jgi:hypothetical protein